MEKVLTSREKQMILGRSLWTKFYKEWILKAEKEKRITCDDVFPLDEASYQQAFHSESKQPIVCLQMKGKHNQLFAYDERQKMLVVGPKDVVKYKFVEGAFLYLCQNGWILETWNGAEKVSLQNVTDFYEDERVNGCYIFQTDVQGEFMRILFYDCLERRLTEVSSCCSGFSYAYGHMFLFWNQDGYYRKDVTTTDSAEFLGQKCDFSDIFVRKEKGLFVITNLHSEQTFLAKTFEAVTVIDIVVGKVGKGYLAILEDDSHYLYTLTECENSLCLLLPADACWDSGVSGILYPQPMLVHFVCVDCSDHHCEVFVSDTLTRLTLMNKKVEGRQVCVCFWTQDGYIRELDDSGNIINVKRCTWWRKLFRFLGDRARSYFR